MHGFSQTKQCFGQPEPGLNQTKQSFESTRAWFESTRVWFWSNRAWFWSTRVQFDQNQGRFWSGSVPICRMERPIFQKMGGISHTIAILVMPGGNFKYNVINVWANHCCTSIIL